MVRLVTRCRECVNLVNGWCSAEDYRDELDPDGACGAYEAKERKSSKAQPVRKLVDRTRS